MNQHPFQYSINLLKLAIDKIPPLFPEEKRAEISKKYEELYSNVSASQEEIDRVITDFGKEKWPFRKAFEKIYETYAKEGEEDYFLEKLNPELKEKFLKFKESGSSLENIRQGKKLEEYFNPEEKLKINEAEVEARQKLEDEVKNLILGESREEYQRLLTDFEKQLFEMLEKIKELKSLAEANPDLSAEILEKVRVFEEGFSITEKDASLEKIKGMIDYFKGLIAKKNG